MFSLGEKGSSRSKGKRKLVSNIPLDVFLLDVGGGCKIQEMEQDTIHLDDVCSIPFLALWQGLNHPAVEWKGQSHFDWKSFDEIALAGGVASTNASAFASFAVLAGDYVNLNMRFGYHFTLVDALCCNDASKNYCQLRFAGGGGNYSGRSLRIQYVDTILGTIGFQTTCRGDLLDARIKQVGMDALSLKLQLVGRLLGETKLLDMRLKDKQMMEKQLHEFWQGRYENESER
jgi:pyruvate,water dikinase